CTPRRLSTLFTVLFLRPAFSPPFPYTTLFRSHRQRHHRRGAGDLPPRGLRPRRRRAAPAPERRDHRGDGGRADGGDEARAGEGRSEEHTSELQSRENYVCRILLDKIKKAQV